MLIKSVITVLKIIFIFSIGYYLIKMVDADVLAGLFSEISIPFFIITVLVCSLDKVIMGLKWNLLLRVFHIKVPVLTPVIVYLRGKVFQMFTPAGIGMDVYKVYFIRKCGAPLVNTISSIFVERFVGVLSSLAIIALLLNFSLQVYNVHHMTIVTSLGIILFLIITIVLFILIEYSKNMKTLSFPKIIPEKIGDNFNKFRRALSRVGDKKKNIWLYYIFSIFEKIFYGTAIFLSARSIGINNVDYIFIISAAPLLALLERLPVSISALGVREGMFVILFRPYFADPTIAITVAIVLRCAEIVMSFFCLLLWFGRENKKLYKSKLQAINAEIESVKV